MDPFPFFDLPLPVQTEIVRRYLSTHFKALTLQDVPEFGPLLDRRGYCWLDPSESLFRLIDLIRSSSIRGLYAYDDDKSHLCRVSIRGENISFEFLGLDEDDCLWVSRRALKFMASPSEVSDFLVAFADGYRPLKKKRNVKFYGRSEIGYFEVDHSENFVRWTNGSKFNLHETMCLIYKHWRLTVISEDFVCLECLRSCLQCPRASMTFEPVDIKKLGSENEVMRCNFRLVEGGVSVRIDDYYKCPGVRYTRLPSIFSKLKQLPFEIRSRIS